MPQAVTVTSPPGVSALIFQSLRGREELGRLFEFQVELLSEDAAIKLADVVGQNITITAEFPDGRKRYFNGDVVEFRQLHKAVDKMVGYFAVLRPRLWFLGLTSDCKIFPNKSAPDIIKAILDEHGITDVTRSLSGTYAVREYCVQYNETDLDFISRLMEEEGIYYYFTHASGKHILVLSDSLSAHSAIAGTNTLPFMGKKAGYSHDLVYDWNVTQRAASGTYAHTDYDFTKPRADLKSQSAITRTSAHSSMERFAFPGTYTESADGTTIARRRIEELQAGWEVVEGKTNAAYFAAGKLFTLKDYARADQNREHLLTVTDYDLSMETTTAAGAGAGQQDSGVGVYFDCAFTAIDSQRPFRAACLTPRPIVQGPQTALVVGKQGEEIWTDQYGRVKVQFYWDRLGQKNENSSCWLRVSQPWAGKGWGAIALPRIGEEVIVEFLSGDPDRPIVTGRVYNAEQKVPYDLPTNQTQSGLKTRSTKEGDAETYNELRFEDKKGEEQVYFHAEKNFDRVVENNDTLTVGMEKKDRGDQTITIYNHRTATLEKGNDSLTIKEGNRVTEVTKGSQSLAIKEGSREAKIKTDDSLELESGNQTITIKQGNQTIKIEAGKGSIEAATELLLKVGESSIKITPSSIELTSVNIKHTANGQFEASGAQTKVAGSGMLDLDGGAITLN
jgi:type VI secretion system secreted protein VgrG